MGKQAFQAEELAALLADQDILHFSFSPVQPRDDLFVAHLLQEAVKFQLSPAMTVSLLLLVWTASCLRFLGGQALQLLWFGWWKPAIHFEQANFVQLGQGL